MPFYLLRSLDMLFRCTRSLMLLRAESESSVCRALRELGPWERHKMILQHRRPVGSTEVLPVLPAPKSDAAALREAHEFIRRDCGSLPAQATWGERLAARCARALCTIFCVHTRSTPSCHQYSVLDA